MTWSKASTTTNSFVSGDGDHGDNNVLVIGEYIDYLVTRGWVLAREGEFSDSPLTGDRTWLWNIYKVAVCEDGGSSEWGYAITYIEDIDSGDYIRLLGWDRGSDTLGAAYITTIGVNASNADRIAGKWSFWESDLDSDSLFVMAGESSEDQIFGFWPPEGTIHKQGGGEYNIKGGGFKIIGNGSMVYGSNSSYTNASMSFPWSAESTSYLQGMNAQTMKLDLCLGMIKGDSYKPLFSSYGGDIHSYLNLIEGSQCLSTLDQFNETNVYLIDGRYYISWGYQSSMLFDCGETAPVF